jgi:hypothetical protein
MLMMPTTRRPPPGLTGAVKCVVPAARWQGMQPGVPAEGARVGVPAPGSLG